MYYLRLVTAKVVWKWTNF